MRLHTVLNTAWAALPLLLAALALRPVTERSLQRFTDRHEVARTGEADAFLRRLLFRWRAMRLAGAAIGLSVPSLAFATGLHVSSALSLGVAGYLTGAFVASVLPSRPRTRTRSASLLPRRAADYLPRSSLLGPWVAVAVSAGATLVYVLEPRTGNSGAAGLTSVLVVTVVAALASALAVRIVVRRPQPVGSADELAVDDALRAEALHTLTAAGFAIGLLGTAGSLFVMGGYASNHLVRAAGVVAGFTAFAGAIVAWFFRIGYWTVSRTFTS